MFSPKNQKVNPSLQTDFMTEVSASAFSKILIVGVCIIGFSAPCFSAQTAQKMTTLDFSIHAPIKADDTKKQTQQAPQEFHYQQQTLKQISTFSNYQVNNWFEVELDMQGLKSHNDLAQPEINAKAFSAFANFGHAIDYANDRFRPFAKLGVGYEEDKATFYNPNYIESNRLNKTQLQYGVGVRYSRQNWNSFGVSFSYQANSQFLGQSLGESNPNYQQKDSIDLKFDFGF